MWCVCVCARERAFVEYSIYWNAVYTNVHTLYIQIPLKLLLLYASANQLKTKTNLSKCRLNITQFSNDCADLGRYFPEPIS